MKKLLLVGLAICALMAFGDGVARPVWVDGAAKEMNAFYGFAATFDAKKGEKPVLRLSAGAIARAWVNGRFAGYYTEGTL